MRVVVLRGSPKRGGSSDTIADSLLKGLKKTGPIEVSDFVLNDMTIRPCQGCESCMTSKDHKCVIDDDMHQIYSVFAEAEDYFVEDYQVVFAGLDGLFYLGELSGDGCLHLFLLLGVVKGSEHVPGLIDPVED